VAERVFDPASRARLVVVRLCLATQNPHKVTELRALLRACAPELENQLELLSLSDLAVVDEVVEDGATFAANAQIKARAAALATGLWALADDSGLQVDALGGAPGVLSARYAGEPRSDARNLSALLAAIAAVPAEARGASFHCSLCLCGPSATAADTYLSEGSVSGSLLTVASGQDGFGYDPIFVPTEAELHAASLPLTFLGQSFAMLSLAQKNQLSHRTRAVRAMLPNLIALVAQQNA